MMGGERPLTRKELEQIRDLNRELELWSKRLQEIRYRAIPGVRQMDGMPFQHTNEISNPTFNVAADLEETEQIVRGIIAQINRARREVYHFITGIEDSHIRQILECRCVSGMSWEEVAEWLGEGHTPEAVRQIYHRFLAQSGIT